MVFVTSDLHLQVEQCYMSRVPTAFKSEALILASTKGMYTPKQWNCIEPNETYNSWKGESETCSDVSDGANRS